MPWFPKWRIRIMGGVMLFFFLSWYNCGMLLWEKGLRPLLLIGFVLSAFLFFLLVRRSKKRVKKQHITCWRSHLLINLFFAWFIGFFPAAIFQSIWVSGAQYTESRLIQMYCSALVIALIFGFLIISSNASGENWGYDPEEEKKQKKKITAIDIAMYHAIKEGIRQEEIENERNYCRYHGLDDSDLDNE